MEEQLESPNYGRKVSEGDHFEEKTELPFWVDEENGEQKISVDLLLCRSSPMSLNGTVTKVLTRM